MGTPWRDRALSLAQSAATTSTTVVTIARHDPWLLALATLHASTLALVLAARDNQALQLAVLGAGFAIVRGGGAINAALGDTWRAFASHDYFDPGGAFYAAAVAAPLLGIMCVQLVSVCGSRAWGKRERERRGCVFWATLPPLQPPDPATAHRVAPDGARQDGADQAGAPGGPQSRLDCLV